MSSETKIYLDIFVSAIYLCFLITSILDTKGKRIISPINGIFAMLILHSLSGLASDYLDWYQTDYIAQYVFCSIYALTGFLSLFFYGAYYVETCDVSRKIRTRLAWLNRIILIINLAVTFPLIPSGLFFSVSPDCVYTRGPLFFFSYLFVFIHMLTLTAVSVVFMKDRRKSIGYIAYTTFPLAASILMVVFPLAGNFVDLATVLSCILLYSFVYLDEKQKVLENETKLTKYKTDIMLSQIGPHFLYNTLSTIAALCSVDPERAQNLTADFSDYLRTNLNLANTQRLSTFDDELKHTKKYIEIEQVRFGNRLKVEYDIKETQFVLPSLSLQPLVENAVKHGVTAKEEGGTIKISTECRNGNVLVKIADDGVGFDAKNLKPREGHYGLFTAKERIKILLDGDVDIQSEPGVGTVVTITVKQTTLLS